MTTLPPSTLPGAAPIGLRSDIISARNVAKHWGPNVALADIDIELERGVTGLLGSNGAGKTTFMSLVLGLHDRTAGEMTVLGHDPQTEGAKVRGRIGYAPEHHHLPPDVQANDLVRHLAQLHGLPKRAATERASDAMWQVGLGEERFRPIGTMSTGQRQRVKLAGAIAHDPELILLDEPTDGLDPVQRDDMLELIARIGGEFGIDILLSSHLLDEVDRICDNVVIFGGGRVTRSGPLAALRGAVTGLTLEVDHDADAVARVLVAAGCSVDVDGLRLTVTAEDSAQLHDLARDAVADTGVGLRQLKDRQVTLEDVFLEANDATDNAS
jgi:ABC-2 type transport system ATP-binding protein